MTSVLEIDGKLLHSIRDAARVASYSRDYITRLARDEKIVAAYIGRQWFVDLDSLRQYVETATLEQEIRKKNLRAERLQEKELRESAETLRALQLQKASKINLRATSIASLVLCLGLFSGFATYKSVLFPTPSGFNFQQEDQIAQVSLSNQQHASSVAEVDPVLKVDVIGQVGETHFTQELRSIGDTQNGILLLPNNASSTDVGELFSDKVVVRESSNGTKMVMRIDMEGNVVGNAMPFVEVPVERQEI